MSSIIAWITAHSGIVCGLVIAILDFVFAISPSLAANGILHQLFIWAGGTAGGTAGTTPSSPTPPAAS
jgi:hypothetical protein